MATSPRTARLLRLTRSAGTRRGPGFVTCSSEFLALRLVQLPLRKDLVGVNPKRRAEARGAPRMPWKRTVCHVRTTSTRPAQALRLRRSGWLAAVELKIPRVKDPPWSRETQVGCTRAKWRDDCARVTISGTTVIACTGVHHPVRCLG